MENTEDKASGSAPKNATSNDDEGVRAPEKLKIDGAHDRKTERGDANASADTDGPTETRQETEEPSAPKPQTNFQRRLQDFEKGLLENLPSGVIQIVLTLTITLTLAGPGSDAAKVVMATLG